MNPQGKEWNLSLPTKHEDHIAGKGFTTVSRYNLVHKFFRCLKRWKFRMYLLQCTRNGRNLRQSQHGNWRKSRGRRRLFSKHKDTNRKVHFAALMDICHLKKRGVRIKVTEVQGQSRAPWWHGKRLEPTQFLLNRARLRPKWLPLM